MAIVGIDVGTGFCKAVSENRQVMFPNLVVVRYKSLWDHLKVRETTLVGDIAEKALSEPSRVLRSVSEGRIIHEVQYSLVASEAIKRLGFKPEKTRAIVGVPCRTSKEEQEKLQKTFKEQVKLMDVKIYPSSYGTLLSMGLDSGVVIDIGEGTTDFLVVDKREIITVETLTVAVDSLLETTRNRIIMDYGIDLRQEEIRSLIMKTTESLSKYLPTIGIKTITHETVKDIIREETTPLAEEIASTTRTLLLHASSEALKDIILTGGGSIIYKDALQTLIPEVRLKVPEDPVYANAKGLYKIAEETYPRIMVEEENQIKKKEEK